MSLHVADRPFVMFGPGQSARDGWLLTSIEVERVAREYPVLIVRPRELRVRGTGGVYKVIPATLGGRGFTHLQAADRAVPGVPPLWQRLHIKEDDMNWTSDDGHRVVESPDGRVVDKDTGQLLEERGRLYGTPDRTVKIPGEPNDHDERSAR